MSGYFITIEGIEGAGKSTAVSTIQTFLDSLNIATVLTREPGGTAIAEEIRKLLLHREEEALTSQTELLLMFAARAQHLANLILPALKVGKWVVSDRFIDASYAYQNGGRQLNADFVRMLDQWVVANHYPDLTLLLDVPAAVGLERALARSGRKDRIEQESLDFFTRVRDAYLARAKQNRERIKVIDASLSITAVSAQINQHLSHFFEVKTAK